MKILTVTSVTVDSPGAGQFTVVGTYTTGTPGAAAQQVTVGETPAGNKNWSRGHRFTSEVLMCLRASVGVAMNLLSWSKIAVAFEPTLTYAPKVNTQPANAACVASSTVATFNVTDSSSELTATYQWQYSADGSTGWTNASGTVNGCAYTNGTTATLTCTPTTTGQTGYYHRCQITNALGTTTTDGLARLTITT